MLHITTISQQKTLGLFFFFKWVTETLRWYRHTIQTNTNTCRTVERIPRRVGQTAPLCNWWRSECTPTWWHRTHICASQRRGSTVGCCAWPGGREKTFVKVIQFLTALHPFCCKGELNWMPWNVNLTEAVPQPLPRLFSSYRISVPNRLNMSIEQ